MKTIFTLLLLGIFSSSVFADTRLSITALSNNAIKVVIDGRDYGTRQMNNDEDFVLSGLSAGRHKIEVYSNRFRRDRNGYFNNNNRPQLIWSGNIYLRDRYHTDIVINRFGKAFTDEEYIDGGYGNQGSYPYGGYNNAMSSRDFENLRRTVAAQSFDQNASNVIQQAAQQNYFDVEQVKTLLKLLKFDDSRLASAKLLYTRTVDRRNFYLVNEAFAFNTTKEDLSRWLLQQPQ